MSVSSDFAAALTNFSTAVKTSVKRKVAQTAHADDAAALSGNSASTLVGIANSHTDQHANDKSNPHNTQAAALGTYTQAQINAKAAACLPSGILPVSAFGDAAGTAIPVTLDYANGQANFEAGIPCLIAGQFFTLPSFSVPFGKTNATTYFYLQLTGGVPAIVSSTTPKSESNTTMYLGLIQTDASGATMQYTLGRVDARLDTFRPSASAAGSAIAVSATGNSLAWQ